MNPQKVKLLTTSISITVGLCISVGLAAPVLFNRDQQTDRRNEVTESITETPDDLTQKSQPQGARRSYAS